MPILHGGDVSLIGGGGAVSSLSGQKIAEEEAQFEEKLAQDLNLIVALEKPNWLPHIVCCYLVNPFGTFGSESATAHARFGTFSQAVLLRAWNGKS